MPNTTSPNDHSPNPSTKTLELIKQEDDGKKFFSRLLSKESSIANSSFRVYYGGVAGAVPFIWESQPGTPKHAFFSDNLSELPPLTPPPSSFRSTTSTNNDKQPAKDAGRSGSLRRILRKIGLMRRSLSMVGSSSSKSSSVFVPIKPMDYRRRRSRFSSQGSFDSINPIDYDEEEEEEEEHVAEPQPGSCLGIGWRNRNGPRGCHGW